MFVTRSYYHRATGGLLLLLALVLLLAAPISPTHAQIGDLSRPTHVLVISLDGARPDALQQAAMPHLDALVARGAASWTAQTIYPPATLPAHTSMLTGLDVPDHGRDWNDNLDRRPLLAIPTFLTLAHDAGYRTALVSGKQKFEQFNQPGVDDFTFVTNGDPGVALRTVELLQAGYEVILAHFPNPDYFGHRDGWMSESYLYELRNTDANIGAILEMLDARSLTDETLVIVTADHGGHGIGHGERIPEDMRIPWIVAGPGVTPGALIERPVHVYDTAATVLWALGLPVPPRAAGRPVTAAFTDEARQAWPLVVETEARLSDAAWSPDGSRLAVAGETGVTLYNRNLRPVGGLDGTGHVYAVTWSPDGLQLATGGADAVIRLWERAGDGDAFTLRRLIFTEHQWIISLSWSPDGRRFAAFGVDSNPNRMWGQTTIWNTVDWTPLPTPPGLFRVPATILTWGNVIAWRLAQGEAINSLAWSPDGDRLAVIDGAGAIQVFDVRGLVAGTA